MLLRALLCIVPLFLTLHDAVAQSQTATQTQSLSQTPTRSQTASVTSTRSQSGTSTLTRSQTVSVTATRSQTVSITRLEWYGYIDSFAGCYSELKRNPRARASLLLLAP